MALTSLNLSAEQGNVGGLERLAQYCLFEPHLDHAKALTLAT
ncbi:hypothetical protein [Chelonobacter oris]|nr:hypothetical protein [Chelonobacter oris]